MFKKVLATLATLFIGVGMSVVAVAGPASAHDVNDSVTCNTLTVQPQSYETRNNNPKPNSIVVTIDGAEVLKTTFGSSLPKQTFNFDGTQVHSWSIVIDAVGGTKDTQYDVNKSGKTSPCTFDWNWKYADPTCDALNVLYPANIPAGQANDVNVRIQYGANYGNEITLNFHNNTGTWSGAQSFVYASHPNWPANIGKYRVVWTQVAGTNYHWQGEIKCGSDPQDATAVVTTTPASCDAAESNVVVTVANATYVVTYPTATTYKVTATAAAGHLFTNGTNQLVIDGTLAPKQTEGCVKPPECLPKSAVTYTYFPATNNGVVTVVNPNPAKYSNDLCTGFWVTAASWHYTTNNAWPQVLNQVNPLAKITSVGTYPFAAEVGCGQGDIYASFTASPYVGPELFGPNNPFSEKFLHDMGFAGPSPTHMQTATGCNQAPVVVPTASPITECGTYGSVAVPADTAKIDYTLTGNGQTGINTVTAVAISPYVLKNYPVGGWSFNLGAYTDCELSVTLTYVPDCAVDDTNTWSVHNPGEESIVVSFAGGTHTATPGYSTLETAASDDAFTITWGAAGSGIKPGEATVTPSADLPADDPKCIKIAEPVAPAYTTADECGVYGTVTPVEKTGVVYDVQFDKVTGEYTVTATPAYGYYFANDEDQKITYTGSTGAYEECVEIVDASVAYGECVYNEDGSADQRHVSITFDNTGSNKPVLFEVSYASEYNQVVPAGEKVTVQVSDIWPAGGGYEVKAAGQTFNLEIPGCDLPTLPEPKVWEVPTVEFDCTTVVATVSTITYTQGWVFDTEAVEWVLGDIQESAPVITTRAMTPDEITEAECVITVTDPEASTCLSDTELTSFTSWIRIALNANVEYRIDGVLATTEFTEVTPGVHTVTADALGGYTLTGGNPDVWTGTHHEWTFTAVDAATECDPPTLAIVTPEFSYTPLTCTATGTYTLGELAEGTIQWTVNGVEKPVGTYPVASAQTLTFVAAPAIEGDGLDEDWVQPEPVVFSQGAAPCDLAQLAFTGATTSFGLIWVALLLGLTGVGFVLVRRRTVTEK